MLRLSALLMIILCSPNVLGHKVIGLAYSTGDRIEGEIGFSSGMMAKAGTRLRVNDKAGNEIQSLELEEGGYFTFKPLVKTELHLFADLGSGHHFNYVLSDAELPHAKAAYRSTDTSPVAQPTHIDNANTDKKYASSAEIEAAISRQIAPLRREIAKMNEQTRMSDILGGIGYIIGFTGLLAWYTSRKS